MTENNNVALLQPPTMTEDRNRVQRDEALPERPHDPTILVDQKGHHHISFDDLKQIDMPTPTETHRPIAYETQILQLYNQGKRILEPAGFKLDQEEYVVNKSGQRLFFGHTYRNSDPNLKLTIGGRTSYDKSMVAGRAIGATVTVCVNLCIWGDVTFLHKHTQNGAEYLEKETMFQMFKAAEGWDDMRMDRDGLIARPVNKETGYALFGLAKSLTRKAKSPSERLLTTNQEFDNIVNSWENPHNIDAGVERTLWHLYQCFTYHYRNLKPEDKLSKHAAVHRFIMDHSDCFEE